MNRINRAMCILDMLSAGQIQTGESLAMSKPSVTYYVNEVKYPFDTPYCSIRVVK